MYLFRFKLELQSSFYRLNVFIEFIFKVWDTVDHSMLASMRPKSHKVTGELQACCYSPKAKTLLISTDKISFLSLKLK